MPRLGHFSQGQGKGSTSGQFKDPLKIHPCIKDLHMGCVVPSVVIRRDARHLKVFRKWRCHHCFIEHWGVVHRLHLHGFDAVHFPEELLSKLLFQLGQVRVGILLWCRRGFFWCLWLLAFPLLLSIQLVSQVFWDARPIGWAFLLWSLSCFLPKMVTQITGLGDIVNMDLGRSFLLGDWLLDSPSVGYPSGGSWAYFHPQDFLVWGCPRKFFLHGCFTMCSSLCTLCFKRTCWARQSGLLCLWLHRGGCLGLCLRLFRRQPGAHVHHEVFQSSDLLLNAPEHGPSQRFNPLRLPPFHRWGLSFFVLF